MLSTAQPTCFLIADISGYTSYLAGVEIEHAQDIIADLVGTVGTALRPSFRLAKLEGDAAFTRPADAAARWSPGIHRPRGVVSMTGMESAGGSTAGAGIGTLPQPATAAASPQESTDDLRHNRPDAAPD